MKFIKRTVKRFVRLVVVTATLAGLIVVLDAVLSPEGPDRPA